MNDLQLQLYEKASAEQQKFVDELKSQPSEKVIEQAYELVMREDILMIFENSELDDNDIKALLKFDYPLSVCYNKWLKADCSHMEMLRDTIEDFAKDLSNQTKQSKNKYEPER